MREGTTKIGGPAVRKGLLSKVGTAMNLASAGASFVPDDTPVDELPTDDGDLPYTDREMPDLEASVLPEQLPPRRAEAPEILPDYDEEEDVEPAPLAPLRYTPRVRRTFTAAESRNPESIARQTSTYSVTAAVPGARARDIGVFRGSGITHKKRVLKKYKLKDVGYSLDDLSRITGVDRDILQEVYNRGIGAYKTNPLSVRLRGTFEKNVNAPMSKKLPKEQWAMARVWSFLDGNPKHDTDLR